MIPPHGHTLVDRIVDEDRSDALRDECEDCEVVTLDQNLLYDFDNIARGVYSPLQGFMSRNDYRKVVSDMTLEDGTVWPLPIVLDVSPEKANRIGPGERIALQGPDGDMVGLMDVDSVYRYNADRMCRQLFGTTDDDHPGVATVRAKDAFFVGGPIKAFTGTRTVDDEFALTPRQTRVLFKRRGWDTVVGFQTRNVPHRAHEYLQKSALEHVDSLLIQPKIGEKKSGDYTNDAILLGYERLIDHYYPDDIVVLTTFQSRMWYAGPREAVFDSIVRKNYGCTHFSIGRDHAGVGDFYEDFEAQRLFTDLGDIGIDPLYYHYAFYCTVCDGIVSEKICPHNASDRLEPSGTELRETLTTGERPPGELMRPEVAERILALDEVFVE